MTFYVSETKLVVSYINVKKTAFCNRDFYLSRTKHIPDTTCRGWMMGEVSLETWPHHTFLFMTWKLKIL